MRIFSEAIKSFSAGKKCTELFVRLMFWTDWGASGKIERAGMDGSQRQVTIYLRIMIIIMVTSLPGHRRPRSCCVAQWPLSGPGHGAPLLGGRQAPRDRLQQPRRLKHQVSPLHVMTIILMLAFGRICQMGLDISICHVSRSRIHHLSTSCKCNDCKNE